MNENTVRAAMWLAIAVLFYSVPSCMGEVAKSEQVTTVIEVPCK